MVGLGISPLIANERLETTNTIVDIDADALLQASRRVDWRFLLPDPNLGQVAYVGPRCGPLLESLRLFSASLTVIGTSQAYDGPPLRYDVVVVSRPSRQVLRQAAELVKPNGFLYVEVYGLFWPGRLRWQSTLKELRLSSPTGCIALVKRLGFSAVQAHWHWPNFESCTKLIPLDDQGALLYALVPGRSSLAARLKATVGQWLLRRGLLARLVPCFSVVAQRGIE
jgi:hypothetical protein